MPGQFDYQSAKQAGYSDQEIQAFLKQNPDLIPKGAPTQAPTYAAPANGQLPFLQGGNQTKQMTASKSNSNPLLEFLLPTAGGIGGALLGGAVMPFGGEIIGGAAGAAGGQALVDKIEGKDPGADVVGAGVGGLAGGVGGKALGFLGSKVLGGVGDSLASGGLNLTKGQISKFVAEHGSTPSQVLLDSNLAGSNADTLERGIGGLNKQYGALANQDIPISQDTFLNNAAGAIQNLRTQAPSSAKGMADKIEQELQQNVMPVLSNNPTMSDIMKLKKQYDATTTAAQFNKDPAQWDVNRAVGSILRKTLNDTADEHGVVDASGNPLSKLGQQLNKLHDLNDFAQGRQGYGGAGTLFSNSIGTGAGALAASAIGANPLAGLLVPAARYGASAAKANPTVAGILAKGALKAGQAADKAKGLLTIGGILGGAGAVAGNGDINPNSQQSGVINGAGDNANGAPNNNYNEGSPNQQTDNTHANNIAQSGTTVKGFDGKSEFPAALPPASQLANAIPGQPYPQEKYLSDVQTIQADMQRASGNPIAQEQLANELRTVEAQKTANDQYVSTYINQNGLNGEQQSFVKTAPVTYQNMNELRGLIQKYGADGLFKTVMSDNPVIQYIKTQKDPSGDYARMVGLIGQLRGQAAKAIKGGNPSNFDIEIASSLDPTSSRASNLANLDQAQRTFLGQYQQFAPIYGLSLSANPQTQQSPDLTGHPILNQALGQ